MGKHIVFYACKRFRAAFSLYVIAQQNIDGNIKKIRKLNNKAYIRNGKLCFPFINGSRRYAKHFRKLLLGKSLLFSKASYIFSKQKVHFLRSFLYEIYFSTATAKNEHIFGTDGIFFIILTV